MLSSVLRACRSFLNPSFLPTVSSSLRFKSCWKCGSNNPNSVLFCTKNECGVIQSPSPEATQNFFKALGVPEQYNLDQEALSKKFKEFQKQLHPDKFAQRSPEERELSDAVSSLVNKAYQVLRDDVDRGKHLLKVAHEVESNEKFGSGLIDQEFLAKIMNFNETMGEQNWEQIQKEAMQEMEKLKTGLEKAFKTGSWKDAEKILSQMTYFDNIIEKAKSFERMLFK